jgi:uncharacterized protein
MKYLLVLGLLFVVFWLWRSGRSRVKGPSAPAPGKQELTEIVACDYCHVHLPRTEALIGQSGTFCSDAHRREAGF